MSRLIELILKYIPTIYFILSVAIHTLIGYKRGLKRSLSFLYRTLIVFGIYLVIYLLVINLSIIDQGLLNLVNLFMGQNGLQNALGISSSSSSIKDCLVELIPSLMGDNVYATALYDNGAYLRTLVSMVYNLAWFLIIYIFYCITIFIVNRVYCHKNPYKEEKNRYMLEVAHNNVPHGKSKGKLGGTGIGLLRGVVSSIIILSLFGNVLYIASGGKGQNKDDDTISLDDESIDPYVKMYQAVSNYGEYGIYYILNAIDNKENIPFYLYITDVVFHGQINDEETGFNETVSLRSELSQVTSFATEGTKLLFHYGGQEFKDIIMGRDTSKTVLDEIISLYKIEAFQNDFNNLIDQLDLNSYTFNFAFGFAQSFLGNCDDPSSPLYTLPDDSKELLKICFKKGYKSSVIPFESKADEVLPYLNPSLLLESYDVKYIFEMFTKIYEFTGNTYEENDINQTIDTVNLIKDLLPCIEKLSILKTEDKDKLNPVLSRIYAFAEVKYLAAPTNEEQVKSIKKLKAVSASSYYEIDWISELNSLIDVASDLLTSYSDALNTLKDENEDTSNVPLVILEVAKSSKYMNVVNKLSDSVLLENLMQTSLVEYYLEETLASIIGTSRENIILPDNISYVSDGETKGETYKVLSLMNLLATSKDIVSTNNGDIEVNQFVKKLIKGEINDPEDIFNLLKIKNSKDSSSRSEVTSAILDSELFRSTISNYIFNNEEAITNSLGFELVIPSSACETNSNNEKCSIKYEEFDYVLSVIEKADLEAFSSSDINVVLTEFKKVRYEFSSSEILRGSISKYLSENDFDDFKIIIPSKAKVDGVLSSTELNYFFDFVDLVDVDKLSSGDTSYLLETLVTNKDLLFSSQVLKATVSNYIRPIDGSEKEVSYNNVTLIVPDTSLNSEKYVTDKEFEILAEFITLIKDNDYSSLSNDEILTLIYDNEVNGKTKILNSNIINATMVNLLLNQDDFDSYIPETLDKDHQGSKESLYTFSSTNSWYGELKKLINGLGEICYDESSSKIQLSLLDDDSYLKKTVIPSLLDAPRQNSKEVTKLDVVYSSLIIKNKVTKVIDDSLDNSTEPISSTYRDECKDGNYYLKDEISSLLYFLKEYNLEIDDFADFEFESLLDKNSSNYVLNSSRVDSSKLKIDIIYNSTLLKLEITQYIDDSIRDNINDFDQVRMYLKTKLSSTSSNYVYSLDSLKNTLDCLEKLEINFQKDENGDYSYSFNGTSILKKIYNEDGITISDIYSSNIVVGVVSKYLSDYLAYDSSFGNNVIDHPYAYSDFETNATKSFYKQSEMNNLFKLLKDDRLPSIVFDEDNDTYTIDFNKEKIDLEAINELFYQDDEPFYLLDGYLSNVLMHLGSLNITREITSKISSKVYINHDEIDNVLTSLIKLNITKLSSFENIESSLQIGSKEIDYIMSSSILKSSIISSTYSLYPNEEDASKIPGYCNGEETISYFVSINESELRNGLNALLYLSQKINNSDYISFNLIDDITINDIISLYKNDKTTFNIYATSSSLVYNLTSDKIIEALKGNTITSSVVSNYTESKTVWNLSSVSKVSRDIIKQTSLFTTLELISKYI